MPARRSERGVLRPFIHHVQREASMHPIEMKQVKEIILVSDDVQASRRLYRETLGLSMPAAPDRLNLARVGS